MPNKKGQKKKNSGGQLQGLVTVGGGGSSVIGGPASSVGGGGGPSVFNQTKKNLPTLNKLNTHKKSYVSPYSFKAIQKPP
jgi:hypothetical protein